MRFYSYLFALGVIVMSISSCKGDKKVIKQTEVSFTKEGELSIVKSTTDSTEVSVDIEIAKTDYEIQTGLMYRSKMADNHGMLFIFKDTRERSFYMKNTQVALDLIFINENNTIVSFQENAKPFDESSLPSNAPAMYVLEVNAGSVAAWGLSVGDKINYSEFL